jgi:hypothetical protein
MGWNKERYANDAEYRERTLARGSAWRRANREKLSPLNRDKYMKQRYGISRAEYDALFEGRAGSARFAGNHRRRGCASIIAM